MFEPVQPVPAQRPSGGLVASALTPTDESRWQDGIAWRPERCFTAAGFDPCGTDFEEDPPGAANPGVVYYRPVAFRITDECGTIGRFDPTRARRQAEAATSFMVARELQTGALSQANPYATPESGGVANVVNARLASPDATVEPGVWSSDNGVSRLEELARREGLGQDVFVHIPVSVLPLVETVTEGRLLKTKTGATIVADPGYGNVGPDGTPAVGGVWAYATGPVQVRLGEIVTYEDIDHRRNVRYARAERLFAATFDPCIHYALVIDTPDVTP